MHHQNYQRRLDHDGQWRYGNIRWKRSVIGLEANDRTGRVSRSWTSPADEREIDKCAGHCLRWHHAGQHLRPSNDQRRRVFLLPDQSAGSRRARGWEGHVLDTAPKRLQLWRAGAARWECPDHAPVGPCPRNARGSSNQRFLAAWLTDAAENGDRHHSEMEPVPVLLEELQSVSAVR